MDYDIKQELKELSKCCYSPYSGINVSCIIETYSGKLIKGVNVENCAYGSTICAEINAITNFVTLGFKKEDIKEIHLFSNLEKCIMPCGACRQVISEIVPNNAMISIFSENDYMRVAISHFMPNALSRKDVLNFPTKIS